VSSRTRGWCSFVDNCLADALKVGAAIEEIDILDLQTRVAQTDDVDIQLVYNSLMNGSSNHLQAFTGVLAQETGRFISHKISLAKRIRG
jgi:hypothetical protein